MPYFCNLSGNISNIFSENSENLNNILIREVSILETSGMQNIFTILVLFYEKCKTKDFRNMNQSIWA